MLMSRESDEPEKAKAYKNWSSLVDTMGAKRCFVPDTLMMQCARGWEEEEEEEGEVQMSVQRERLC